MKYRLKFRIDSYILIMRSNFKKLSKYYNCKKLSTIGQIILYFSEKVYSEKMSQNEQNWRTLSSRDASPKIRYFLLRPGPEKITNFRRGIFRGKVYEMKSFPILLTYWYLSVNNFFKKMFNIYLKIR